MEKYINKHLLESNCDAVEDVGYTRRFTHEELNERKQQLADASITISEIEAEKKLAADDFKLRLKPLESEKATLIEQLKTKTEYVRERCYKFICHDENLAGFYNSDGELVYTRALQAQEMQKTIFGQLRTGTSD